MVRERVHFGSVPPLVHIFILSRQARRPWPWANGALYLCAGRELSHEEADEVDDAGVHTCLSLAGSPVHVVVAGTCFSCPSASVCVTCALKKEARVLGGGGAPTATGCTSAPCAARELQLGHFTSEFSIVCA